LASSSIGGVADSAPNWHLGWITLADCKGYLANSGVQLSGDSLVYLGSRPEDDVVYWAIDVSDEGNLVTEFATKQLCFVELRTLMVATDWADSWAMGELAIAGHVSLYCSFGEDCFWFGF
jgi:NAD+ diphosphatase